MFWMIFKLPRKSLKVWKRDFWDDWDSGEKMQKKNYDEQGSRSVSRNDWLHSKFHFLDEKFKISQNSILFETIFTLNF